MNTVKSGDKITSDWANSLINAVNAVTHGATALRGGGEMVRKGGYVKGSRPLAFDLVEITDDNGDSIQGKISGGLLFYSSKQDLSGNSAVASDDIKLNVGKLVIDEFSDTFHGGDKVWVAVTYNADEWKPTDAKLEKGSQIPTANESKAYFPVGEFNNENGSVFFNHYGLTAIKWDPIKWGAVGPGLGLEWQTEKTDGCADGLEWLKIKVESRTVSSSTQQDPCKCKVDLSVSPNGLKGDIQLDDCWTVLGCDSGHAIRLRVNSATGKLYIQLGQYIAVSNTYEPQDQTISQN